MVRARVREGARARRSVGARLESCAGERRRRGRAPGELTLAVRARGSSSGVSRAHGVRARLERQRLRPAGSDALRARARLARHPATAHAPDQPGKSQRTFQQLLRARAWARGARAAGGSAREGGSRRRAGRGTAALAEACTTRGAQKRALPTGAAHRRHARRAPRTKICGAKRYAALLFRRECARASVWSESARDETAPRCATGSHLLVTRNEDPMPNRSARLQELRAESRAKVRTDTHNKPRPGLGPLALPRGRVRDSRDIPTYM